MRIPKPKKRKNLSQAKKEAWVVFSVFTRLRDCIRTQMSMEYGNCITCGITKHYKEADAGHFIRRDKSNTFFDERNVHLQCKGCNVRGETLKYRRAINALYGEGTDEELERLGETEKHFTVGELEEIKAYYKNEIRKLESGDWSAIHRHRKE